MVARMMVKNCVQARVNKSMVEVGFEEETWKETELIMLGRRLVKGAITLG